jgi:hypothetical protein
MHVSAARSTRRLHHGWALLPALGLIALATGWAAGETAALYLRVRCAPVRSEPSFAKGEVNATPVAGQAVSVLERSKDGDWVKVRYTPESGDKNKAEPVEGWIHATVLADKPLPVQDGSDGPWLHEGAKGLPEAGAAVREHAARRRQELKLVLEAEKRYPSAKELDAFIKDGNLGLYRPDWPSLEGGLTK